MIDENDRAVLQSFFNAIAAGNLEIHTSRELSEAMFRALKLQEVVSGDTVEKGQFSSVVIYVITSISFLKASREDTALLFGGWKSHEHFLRQTFQNEELWVVMEAIRAQEPAVKHLIRFMFFLLAVAVEGKKPSPNFALINTHLREFVSRWASVSELAWRIILEMH